MSTICSGSDSVSDHQVHEYVVSGYIRKQFGKLALDVILKCIDFYGDIKHAEHSVKITKAQLALSPDSSQKEDILELDSDDEIHPELLEHSVTEGTVSIGGMDWVYHLIAMKWLSLLIAPNEKMRSPLGTTLRIIVQIPEIGSKWIELVSFKVSEFKKGGTIIRLISLKDIKELEMDYITVHMKFKVLCVFNNEYSDEDKIHQSVRYFNFPRKFTIRWHIKELLLDNMKKFRGVYCSNTDESGVWCIQWKRGANAEQEKDEQPELVMGFSLIEVVNVTRSMEGRVHGWIYVSPNRKIEIDESRWSLDCRHPLDDGDLFVDFKIPDEFTWDTFIALSECTFEVIITVNRVNSTYGHKENEDKPHPLLNQWMLYDIAYRYINDKIEHKELFMWLHNTVGLKQYFDGFINLGIEDLLTMQYVTYEMLSDHIETLGHRLKLMHYINKLNINKSKRCVRSNTKRKRLLTDEETQKVLDAKAAQDYYTKQAISNQTGYVGADDSDDVYYGSDSVFSD